MNTTVSALVRVSPSLAATVEQIKTSILPAWNASTLSCLFSDDTLPVIFPIVNNFSSLPQVSNSSPNDSITS